MGEFDGKLGKYMFTVESAGTTPVPQFKYHNCTVHHSSRKNTSPWHQTYTFQVIKFKIPSS
jgi:hypothetical protein